MVARLLWERGKPKAPQKCKTPENPLFMRVFGTI